MSQTNLFDKDPLAEIEVPPKPQRPKRIIKKKKVARFVDAGGTVRVWYEAKHDELCFKRAGRSKTSRMSLREIYDKVIGQRTLDMEGKEPVKLVFQFK